jgi:hypothetical protein
MSKQQYLDSGKTKLSQKVVTDAELEEASQGEWDKELDIPDDDGIIYLFCLHLFIYFILIYLFILFYIICLFILRHFRLLFYFFRLLFSFLLFINYLFIIYFILCYFISFIPLYFRTT